MHRSTRELIEEVEHLLAPAAKSGRGQHPLPGQASPLDCVAALLVKHRDYLHVAVYLNAGARLVQLAAAGAVVDCGIMELGQGVVGKVAESGRERVVADVNADPDYYRVLAETRSECAAPAKIGNHVLAVVNAESARPAAFSYDHVVLLRRTAELMGTFLAGRGKYLMLEARETVADHLKPRFQSHARPTPKHAVAGEKSHS